MTSRFPKHINAAPARTRSASFPHRDITMPAMSPPSGVARDGIARRAPAFVGLSRRMTWKSSGSVKRNCGFYVNIQTQFRAEGEGLLTAYAAMPTQTLAICVETGCSPCNIFSGMRGAAVVVASTAKKAAVNTKLTTSDRITQMLLHGNSLPPRLSPTSWLDRAKTRRRDPKKSIWCQIPRD